MTATESATPETVQTPVQASNGKAPKAPSKPARASKAKKAPKSTPKAQNATQAKPSGKKRHSKDAPTLLLPQFRVLKALLPNAKGELPLLTRVELAVKAGFTPISGTINRALAGIKKSAPQAAYAAPHKGLLALGYVERIEDDSDGHTTTLYRITKDGRFAAKAYLDGLNGSKVRKVRDREASINTRYDVKKQKRAEKAAAKTKAAKSR